MSSVFQPICGTLRLSSRGAIFTTSPLIQPRPSVTSYSRPRSAINCMPTQMPKKGRALTRTVSFSDCTMPSSASSPRRQSAKAPTPGKHHPVGAIDGVRIARDDDLLAPSCARRARTLLRRSADCPNRNRRWRRSTARPGLGKQSDDGWHGCRPGRHRIGRRHRGRQVVLSGAMPGFGETVEEATLRRLKIVGDHDADIRKPRRDSVQRRNVPPSSPSSTATNSSGQMPTCWRQPGTTAQRRSPPSRRHRETAQATAAGREATTGRRSSPRHRIRRARR